MNKYVNINEYYEYLENVGGGLARGLGHAVPRATGMHRRRSSAPLAAARQAAACGPYPRYSFCIC